jgi:hypothetical protein
MRRPGPHDQCPLGHHQRGFTEEKAEIDGIAFFGRTRVEAFQPVADLLQLIGRKLQLQFGA